MCSAGKLSQNRRAELGFLAGRSVWRTCFEISFIFTTKSACGSGAATGRTRQFLRMDVVSRESKPESAAELSFIDVRSVWRTVRNREKVTSSLGFCSMSFLQHVFGEERISTLRGRYFAPGSRLGHLRSDSTHICDGNRLRRRRVSYNSG